MRKFKARLWVTLMAIGFMGVVSLLFSELPLDRLPEEATQKFSLQTLRVLVLINPALLLILMVTVGVLIYDKVGFRVPVFEKLLNRPDRISFSLRSILKQGVILGILSGVLIVCAARLFAPYLPVALTDPTNQANLHIFTKLLYGGFFEELLTRFGLMSLFVWLLFKIVKQQTKTVYWTAIVLTSLLFALGHLPYVFQLVSEPTPATYAYIILGNSIGGLLCGYAYWKQGLESAFIVHFFAHLTMIALEHLM